MRSIEAAMASLKEEVSDGIQINGLDCDVSDAASVDRLASGAVASMGGIDVWINNAGYSGSFKSFVDMESQQLEKVSCLLHLCQHLHHI